jgi:hypothetical protein
MNNDKKSRDYKQIVKSRTIIALLVCLEFAMVFIAGSLFIDNVLAGVGQNVTVVTLLNVGNVYPEVVNVTIDYDATSIDLTPNSTKLVTITAIVRDYNGETDLSNGTVEFFDSVVSSYGTSDDNNTHYTNKSCAIDLSYGDSVLASVNCTLSVWYNANNATWNATFRINDTYNYADLGSKNIKVNALLAIGLPDAIDYGTVNATNVSSEQIANVTNYGNQLLNLTLEGYAVNRSDRWAMNCSLGTLKNISIYYEKYNLTGSVAGDLNLPQFEAGYTNLTNASVTKAFLLNYQQIEGVNEAINSTYWRIYVPKGVAGSCSGNIIFGATRATGAY